MQFAQSQTLTESRDAGRNITKRNLATFDTVSCPLMEQSMDKGYTTR